VEETRKAIFTENRPESPCFQVRAMHGPLYICSRCVILPSDTVHLANKIVFRGFRDKSFSRVKAPTYVDVVPDVDESLC
jgi:hypothetical protein